MWKVFARQRFIINNTLLFQAIKIAKMPFYAVAKGRTAGIYMTWPDCEAQVKGFPGARYKKFDSVVSAQDFITTEGGSKVQKAKSNPKTSRQSTPSQPNSSNLKRTLTVARQNTSLKKPVIPKKKSKRESFGDSDDSDDLNTIISRQMDDIEKRLDVFTKGVDKIIKGSSKSNRKTILIEQNHVNNTGNGFQVDEDGYTQVYTDGACSANGRNGAKAGLGVYWGEGHSLNISEPVSGRATNNCGEIQAATRAIQLAIDNGVGKLAINTDSKFLINSVTKWMNGWKRKGWKLQSGEPVKNEKDFKELDSIQNKIQIKWNYVEAHRGVHGNEMADQLAKAGATMYNK